VYGVSCKRNCILQSGQILGPDLCSEQICSRGQHNLWEMVGEREKVSEVFVL
jgi:hypothetical protein